MRFLLHGNSPTAATGYGIQIGQLARQLHADGHQVACSSTWGEQGGWRVWEDGIRIYGSRFDSNGNDSLHMYADHWFDGEPGWIVTVMDVWILKNPRLAEFNIAAWTPVDHWPLQNDVREFFQLTGALPVAMSKFGVGALADLDPAYIPHSVDTSTFRPVADIDGMSPRQKMIGVPDDAFLVGMVGMNKGWARDRKGFNEALRAFAVFEREHPDAYLYMHTEKWGGAEGMNLEMLRVLAGVPEHKLIWSGGPGQLGLAFGYTPQMMAAMYSAFDVLLAPSHGEGFCIPLIEAQACFPATTRVTAVDVLDVMEHRYTGDVLTIETERGDVIEATADHPFWTDEGWVTASQLSVGGHQLLYTGGHAEAEHVHAGRLGDVVASLRDDVPGRSGREDGPDVRVGSLAQESDGAHQAVLADRDAASRYGDLGAVGLHGGDDRRRGHDFHPSFATPHQALHQDRELVGAGHGMVLGSVRRTFDVHREASAETLGRADSLHVPLRGAGVSAAVPGSASVPRHQAAADGVRHRVQRDEVVAEPRGTADSPPVGSHPTSARPEYQAVRSVSRRAVVDFPVYNLRTASGTYMAGGYLVHNCGTPVIVTDFSAQRELCGAGWRVAFQAEYDTAHQSDYAQPIIANPITNAWFDGIETLLEHVDDDRAQLAHQAITELRASMGLGVLDALEAAYDADREKLKWEAVEFAQAYDAQRVYDEHWRPFIASLTAEPDRPDIEREPMDAVAVLCPVAGRTQNLERLAESFVRTTDNTAVLYLIGAPHADWMDDYPDVKTLPRTRGDSCAQGWNAGFAQTTEPWVLLIGDDVVFHEGWIDQPRKLSDEWDVIGTNDTAGKTKNPAVARGTHADHFFVRRTYVDQIGSTLEGPGVLAAEAYHHWFVDTELVKLAKARGVFTPCLDSIVEHLHPGYDGDETARRADPTYMAAVQWSEEDAETFHARLPLIEMQRANRAKL